MDTPANPLGTPATASAAATAIPVTGLNRATALLLAFGGLPIVVAFFLNLWTKEYYQFFPLALAGAAFLGWIRWEELPKPARPDASPVSAFLLVVSFVLLAAATVFWSPWVGMVATLIGLVGAAWWFGGWPLVRALIPAGLLLLTVVPPPLNLDVRFTMKLRALATQWSSVVLDALGVTHALQGNVIEIPYQKLLVEEACSGINSILSTTAVCLFYALWRRRPAWHIVVMLVMTVGFVLLGNVARIVSGGWAQFRLHINILHGWKHETIGLILFASYLCLILSADLLLMFIFSPSRSGSRLYDMPTAPVARTPARLVRHASRWAWVAGVAFGILGLAQCGIGALRFYQNQTESVVSTTALLQPQTRFELPEKIGDWQRVNRESPLAAKVETGGISSQAWLYQYGGMVATLSLDYPIRGYHDVTICYTGNGWDISQRTSQTAPDGSAYLEVRMQKELVAKAILLFSTLDERGQWIDGSYVRTGLMERFRGHTESTTYRVQMLTQHYLPLSPAQEEQLRSFFLQGRQLLRQELLSQMAAHK